MRHKDGFEVYLQRDNTPCKEIKTPGWNSGDGLKNQREKGQYSTHHSQCYIRKQDDMIVDDDSVKVCIRVFKGIQMFSATGFRVGVYQYTTDETESFVYQTVFESKTLRKHRDSDPVILTSVILPREPKAGRHPASQKKIRVFVTRVQKYVGGKESRFKALKSGNGKPYWFEFIPRPHDYNLPKLASKRVTKDKATTDSNAPLNAQSSLTKTANLNDPQAEKCVRSIALQMSRRRLARLKNIEAAIDANGGASKDFTHTPNSLAAPGTADRPTKGPIRPITLGEDSESEEDSPESKSGRGKICCNSGCIDITCNCDDEEELPHKTAAKQARDAWLSPVAPELGRKDGVPRNHFMSSTSKETKLDRRSSLDIDLVQNSNGVLQVEQDTDVTRADKTGMEDELFDQDLRDELRKIEIRQEMRARKRQRLAEVEPVR